MIDRRVRIEFAYEAGTTLSDSNRPHFARLLSECFRILDLLGFYRSHISMTKLQFLFTKGSSRLWVRPTLLSMAAIAWVILAYFSSSFLPAAWRVDIEKETLVNLFTILASTMLTVATFSVSAVATAFSSVSTSGTPRATRIVMSDSAVQSTLAAFLAAFIYAVVAITALSALDFHASGRFFLFVGFVVLIGWVLISFLSWVDRISRLGKLGDTIDRVATAARGAMSNPENAGLLGGRSHKEATRPTKGMVLRFDRFGYVQNVDMASLQRLAEELDGTIWLDIRPGAWVTKNAPIGLIDFSKKVEEEKLSQLLKCFSVGHERTHDTDPRFAMILLAEIADRALSPAVNDPGTGIAVLSVQVELLHLWAEADIQSRDPERTKFDRVFVPAITAEDLLLDAFTSIARDGAGMIEVSLRLQKSLRAIMHLEHEELSRAAAAYREIALELSLQSLPIESQRKAVAELAKKPL